MSAVAAALLRRAAAPSATAAAALMGASAFQSSREEEVGGGGGLSMSLLPSSSVASCQPPSLADAAAAAREARAVEESAGGGDGDGRRGRGRDRIKETPSLDMDVITGGEGKDGGLAAASSSLSKADVIERTRAEVEAKFGNVHEKYPCGKELKDWQMCVLDQTAKEDTKGFTREELAVKQAQVQRRCADPFLLTVLLCRKDEHTSQQAKIIADVGYDKFRAMKDDRDQKMMEERGLEFLHKMKAAEARTDALAEAFRRREGLSPPEEVMPTPPAEEKKWYEIWKIDDDHAGGGGGTGEDSFVTDEQMRKKEEVEARADEMLSSMRQAREEREAGDMGAMERGTASSKSGEECRGEEGGKRWWRFGS